MKKHAPSGQSVQSLLPQQQRAQATSSGGLLLQRQGGGAFVAAPRQVAQQKNQERLQNAPRQTAQRQRLEAIQRMSSEAGSREVAPPGGLPDNLKSGVESLSRISMESVRVHYNPAKPAQLNALAYAQGADTHLGPGQEKQLPHEAWHAVQQAQGHVQPTTMQMKAGVSINDDKTLEHEADVMGAKALQASVRAKAQIASPSPAGAARVSQATGWLALPSPPTACNVVQRAIGAAGKVGDIVVSVAGPSKDLKWEITSVDSDEQTGLTYKLQLNSGKLTLHHVEVTVGAKDPVYDLVQDGAEFQGGSDLSEGYSDSDDIDSPSEGESVELHRKPARPKKGASKKKASPKKSAPKKEEARKESREVIHTKIHSPRSAERRAARVIRDFRNGREPRHEGPFVTRFDDSFYEFSPSSHRKDIAVAPLVEREQGGYERAGNFKTYAELASNLDKFAKAANASTQEFNKCLKYILRENSDASLAELQYLFCKTLDDKSLKCLREMAAIMRVDQSRSKFARSVIDEEVFGSSASFKHRFDSAGHKKPPGYRGARVSGKHDKGGSQSLRNSDPVAFAPRKRARVVMDDSSSSSIDRLSADAPTNDGSLPSSRHTELELIALESLAALSSERVRSDDSSSSLPSLSSVSIRPDDSSSSLPNLSSTSIRRADPTSSPLRSSSTSTRAKRPRGTDF